VRPVRVVVGDVFVQYAFEVAAGDDQDSVETFALDAADPALGMCFRLRCGDRRADHRDSFRAREGVEGFGQLDVAIADQDLRTLPLGAQRGEAGACLLRHPGAVWVGGDASDVHAPPVELDEEEDVEAP
jgi:hypothetical protein